MQTAWLWDLCPCPRYSAASRASCQRGFSCIRDFLFWRGLSADEIPPSTVSGPCRSPHSALHRGKLLKQLLLLLERDLNFVKLPNSTEEMKPFAAGMSRNQNT